MELLERIMGVHSQNEYRGGTTFSLSKMTSQGQILSYSEVIKNLNNSLEDIIEYVFSAKFYLPQQKIATTLLQGLEGLVGIKIKTYKV